MALTIIDKTLPPSPKYVWEPTPTSFTSFEKEKYYWDTQKERWLEGYKVKGKPYLNPFHYFFLQETMVLDEFTHKWIHPNWRDVDEDMFDAHYLATQQKSNYMVLKYTGVGLTTLQCSIGMQTALLNECVIGFTSADKDKLANLISDKLKPLHEKLNPQFRPDTPINNKRELQFGEVSNKKGSRLVVSGSRFLMLNTMEKANAFSSVRLGHGFIDEGFEHPKINSTYKSFDARSTTSGVKTGTVCLGGTSGLKEAVGMQGMAELYADSKALNLGIVWIPAWKGYATTTVNGHSDEKAATDIILRKRDEYAAMNDQSHLLQFIKEFPLTVEEVFDKSQGHVFAPAIMQVVQRQKLYLSTNKVPLSTGSIVEKANGEIKFEPFSEGKIQIYKFPSQEYQFKKQPYAAGTDPIPFVQNETEGSNFAFILMDRFTKEIVCRYVDRSVNGEEITENCILLQKMYFNAKNLIEDTRGSFSIAYYIKTGNKHLLSKRPVFLNTKYSKAQHEKWGIHSNGSVPEIAKNGLGKYVHGYGGTIMFPTILTDIENFGTANTDEADALKYCLLNIAEIERLIKTENQTQTVTRPIVYYARNARGQMCQMVRNETVTIKAPSH